MKRYCEVRWSYGRPPTAMASIINERGKWYADVGTAGVPFRIGVGDTSEEALEDFCSKNNCVSIGSIFE